MELTHLSIFSLLFISLQYILLLTELDKYSDVATDIQGYRFNFYKTRDGNFTPLRAFIYTFGYIIVALFLYRYCINTNMSYPESFIFVSLIYSMWDFCFINTFDKALNHLPVLSYDILVLGGLGMVTTMYIFNNFYPTLKTYLPLLVLFYFATMGVFLYKSWEYNKN
jgi:hypothetical protein